jgi:hypothetical protein
MKRLTKSLMPQNAKNVTSSPAIISFRRRNKPEQVSVAAMIYATIPEMLGSNFRHDSGYIA